MYLHTTYKRPCIRIRLCSSKGILYSECGLVQPFLFRIQLCQVSVCFKLVTLRQNLTLSFGGSSLVRSRSLPTSLTVVGSKIYTLWIL